MDSGNRAEEQGRWLIERGGVARAAVAAAWETLQAEPGAGDLCAVLLARGAIDAQVAEAARAATGGAAPPPAPDGAAPSLEDRFELKRELGRGGMGVVTLAEDRATGAEVVIKRALGLADRGATRERFLREARALAQLRHSGVVGVKDLGEDRGGPYFVMEHVPGASLADAGEEAWRSAGGPPVDWASDLGAALAEALAACHTAGIVHRDVKPDNVIVDARTGQPVLVDFGLVKLTPAAAGESLEQLTRTGQMLGTPEFMAPEQLGITSAFGEVGPPADVWGLGATLFAVLAGEPPYPVESPVELVGAIATGDPRRVRSVARAVPVWLDRVVAACLRRTAADRPTAAEVAAALRERRAPGSAPRARSATLRVAAAVAAVGLATVLVGAWILADRSAPSLVVEGPRERVTGSATTVLRGEAHDPEGAAVRVEAGKRSAQVDATGRFELEVLVPRSGGPVAVTAVDAAGNRSRPVEVVLRRDGEPPAVELTAVGREGDALLVEGRVGEDGCSVVVAGVAAEVQQGRFAVQLPLTEVGSEPAVLATDAAGNTARVDLPVAVVALGGGGTHESVSTAVADVPDGGVVLVRPGRYPTAWQGARSVSVVGVGGPERAVLVVDPSAPIEVRGGDASVEGVDLELREGPVGVRVSGGTLRLRDCRVASEADWAIQVGQTDERRAESEPAALELEEVRVEVRLQTGSGIRVTNARIGARRSRLEGRPARALTDWSRALLLLTGASVGTLQDVEVYQTLHQSVAAERGARLRLERCLVANSRLEGLRAADAEVSAWASTFQDIGAEAVWLGGAGDGRLWGGDVVAYGRLDLSPPSALVVGQNGWLYARGVRARGPGAGVHLWEQGIADVRGCDLSGNPRGYAVGAATGLLVDEDWPPDVAPVEVAEPTAPIGDAASLLAKLGADDPSPRAAARARFLGAADAVFAALIGHVRWLKGVQQIGLTEFGALVPEPALARLVTVAEDPTAKRPWDALKLLAFAGSRARFLEARVAALAGSRDVRLREAACAALATMQAEQFSSGEALAASVDLGLPGRVVSGALRALTRLGEPAQVAGPRLLEVLDHEDDATVALALRALERIPAVGVGAVDVLTERLAPSRGLRREQVARALAFQLRRVAPGGDARYAALLEAGPLEQRLALIRAAFRLGPVARAGLEAQLAGSGPPRLRAAAARALATLEAVGSGDALTRALDDEAPEVARSAAIALGLMGGGGPAGRAALARRARVGDPWVRTAALWALGRSEPERAAIAALQTGLRDPDPFVRGAALDAVAALRGAAADLAGAVEALRPSDDLERKRQEWARAALSGER